MKRITKKFVEREVINAVDNVSKALASSADGSFYSKGLSSEGYVGGYRDALLDVLLVLNGVKPNDRKNSRYWDTPTE